MNKNLIKYGKVFQSFGLHRLAQIIEPRKNVRITYTHEICPEDMENFARIVQYLSQVRTFISPQQFFAFHTNQQAIDGRLLMMTFDDGLLSSYNAARHVLDPLGIKAIFFIPTAILELKTEEQKRRFAANNLHCGNRSTDSLSPAEFEFMTAGHLSELAADGHTIYPHTHNHVFLRDINDEKTAQTELVQPKHILEDLLHTKIKAFAFPVGTERQAGNYAYRHIQKNYEFCFTALNGVNTTKTDPYRLHRDCLPPDAPLSYIKMVLEGTYDLYYALKMRRLKALTKQHRILDVRFDLADYASVFNTIDQWRQRRQQAYITLANPHSVLLCHRDKQMRQAISIASLTLPDGAGIIWACNILGYENHSRVTGPELMLKLCDWGRKDGYRHYFYGGNEGVADSLACRLSEMYPGLQVAGTYCPPFRQLRAEEDKAVVEKINAAKPDIVWVGLGAPKQEKWMAQHLGMINATVMVGVGAAFDFHSGNVKWAPACFRKFGLEWAWRLACEPKRMWRRNLDSPLFLGKVIFQRLNLIKCS
jgi:N-acetylglucosaminyldiphosphoundecaprenol N-acetyl-beta-D-mannosaminyltransferase